MASKRGCAPNSEITCAAFDRPTPALPREQIGAGASGLSARRLRQLSLCPTGRDDEGEGCAHPGKIAGGMAVSRETVTLSGRMIGGIVTGKPLVTRTLLTYMATIASAVDDGVLVPFTLPRWELRQPIRPIYVAPALRAWIMGTDELWDETLGRGRRTRADHLEQMFCDFCCAEHPGAGEIRRVVPTRDGILKFQPFGSRVLGWCPAPHQFVAVSGCLKLNEGNTKLVNDAMQRVKEFIRNHDLADTVLRGELNELFPREK